MDQKKVIYRNGFIVSLVLGLLSLPTLADSGEIHSEYGRLLIKGMLVESTCHLAMSSAWQEIDLGTISTKDFIRPGDQGTPIPFTLNLVNCVRSHGWMSDKLSATTTVDTIQPIVSVSFQSMRDERSPQYIKVYGASGIGLKIKDVTLGQEGRPQFVNVPQGELNYTMTPVRTQGALIPGNLHAVIDFRVSYD